MGIVIVEVCDVNPSSALDLEQLETDYPGVSVMRTPCLSNCSQCAQVPFAYVNGEILTAADPESLLVAIKSAIESELAEWDV